MQARDQALAFLLSAYKDIPYNEAVEEQEKSPKSGTRRGRPAKFRTPEELAIIAEKAARKAQKAEAKEAKALEDAAKNRANVVCLAPAPYSLTAAEFIVRYRAAGRREKTVPSVIEGLTTQVKVCYDPEDVRNDVIELIACFCGYDLNQNFGSQDAMARMRAASILQKQRLDSGEVIPQKVAPVETRGYVAGLPNVQEKVKRRLIAHQWLAVDTLIQHEADVRQAVESGNSEQVTFSQSLAQLERERLDSINRELATFFPEVFETGESLTHETDENDYN